MTLAREYFEGIRSERVKISKTEEMLERMAEREAAKAQSYEIGRGSGGTTVSDAIDRRIDMEGRLKKRAANLQKDIDEALVVLYGAESWEDIADVMQSSKRWCQQLCCAGFVFIDKLGWANVKNV